MCLSYITICIGNCHALFMPPLLFLYVRMRNTMFFCVQLTTFDVLTVL